MREQLDRPWLLVWRPVAVVTGNVIPCSVWVGMWRQTTRANTNKFMTIIIK